MSETELGNLTIVSPSMPPLTSISSASVNRVNDSETASVSLTQCTSQENDNITENRLQEIERNISSLGETLNRFIKAQKILREQIRKVATQQGDHQLGKSKKALTDQGHPSIDNIAFIVSALNPPCHLSCQSDIDDGGETDFFLSIITHQ